jgi:hypothetical protein
MAVLALAYMAVAAVLQIYYTSWLVFERRVFARAIDSVTFAGSVVLLLALMEQSLLVALGNTKPFLFIAGVCGVVYTVFALRPRS